MSVAVVELVCVDKIVDAYGQGQPTGADIYHYSYEFSVSGESVALDGKILNGDEPTVLEDEQLASKNIEQEILRGHIRYWRNRAKDQRRESVVTTLAAGACGLEGVALIGVDVKGQDIEQYAPTPLSFSGSFALAVAAGFAMMGRRQSKRSQALSKKADTHEKIADFIFPVADKSTV